MTAPRQPQPDPKRDDERDDHDLIDAQLAPARELTLMKNGQRYVFRWEPGREQELIERFVAMVRDPDCELDWFDAALLSHQLGQRLGRRLNNMIQHHKAAS
jgi:hypothetical protein